MTAPDTRRARHVPALRTEGEDGVSTTVKMPDLAEQLAEIAADPTAYVRRTREMTRMTAAPTGPEPRTDAAVGR